MIFPTLIGLLFALFSDPTPTQIPTPLVPVATSAPTALTVTSEVKIGTAGVALPVGLPVTLHVLRGDPSGDTAEIVTQPIALPADGTLHFATFMAQAGDVCVVTTDYEGATQGSAPVVLKVGETTLALPATLYAGSHDPSAVKITNDEQIINFVPGKLIEVLETVDWTTTGDHFYLSDQKTDDGTPISVTLPLPVGARAVGFSTQPVRRFAIGGDVNAPIVEDTAPVIPGVAHRIVFSYQVPYTVGAYIDRDYPYAADQVSILIPNDAGVIVAGDKGVVFNNAPNTTLAPQRPYTTYTLTKPLAAGGRLVYTLSGAPRAVVDPSTGKPPPSSGLDFGVVLAFLGVAIIAVVAALWFVRQVGLTRHKS
ncbi:MAG: hypothetical protein ACYDBJ_23960 [Aggregatilineales bacterium]